jgi:hypothetical protein
VGISPGGVTILDENIVGIGALVHQAAIGDKFRVELASGFRLFINGILRHERTTGFTGGINYPAFYGQAGVNKHANAVGLTGIPIIPAPRLEGDWRLRSTDQLGNPVVLFTAPTEGAIEVNGLEVTYSDGEKPGAYKLAARIDTGVEIWMEDSRPTGSTLAVETGGTWSFTAPGFSGNDKLQSPNAAGHHQYTFTGATRTLQINPGDVLSCYVFLNASTPPTEIYLFWCATDATGFAHGAYWGADNIAGGTAGTPSKRFMGPLPPTGQWVKLEIPASLVDLEGRTINGASLEIFDGQCNFDQLGKYAGQLQAAEVQITIPPLRIEGEKVRTFQPGQSAIFPTNYDVMPGIVTWSVVSGGGSFNGDVFTAPTAPGTTVLRASSGDQRADIEIRVLAVITPNFPAVGPGEQIDFETNIGPMPIPIGSGTEAQGQGDITPGLPPGIQKNDILLLTVETANESVPTPAGWQIVANSPQSIGTAAGAAATRLSKFWLRVPPTGIVSAPLLVDVGDHQIARIRAYRNCIDTGNPWDITVGNTAASATAVSLPGGITTVPNCLVIQTVAFATDTASPQVSAFANADLTELTEVEDIATTSGNGGGFATVEGKKATAGPFGATTATLAGASVQARLTVALRPALVVWSAAGGGSMNSNTGVFQAPLTTNQERPIRIQATNGTFTATLDVLVLPKFPISRIATPMRGKRQKKVLISEAEDGTDVSRVKNKDGKSRVAYEVQIKLLTLAEFESVDQFWDEMHPSKMFIFEDVPRKIRIIAKFDSEFDWDAVARMFNVAFRVKEAVPQSLA